MIDEGSSVEYVGEWWPSRTNCRVVTPSGRAVIEKGDPTVFWAVFGFWLVVAALLLVRVPWWVRGAGIALAWAASIVIIFELTTLI